MLGSRDLPSAQVSPSLVVEPVLDALAESATTHGYHHLDVFDRVMGEH